MSKWNTSKFIIPFSIFDVPMPGEGFSEIVSVRRLKPGEIDGRHPAATEFFLYGVSVGEGGV